MASVLALALLAMSLGTRISEGRASASSVGSNAPEVEERPTVAEQRAELRTGSGQSPGRVGGRQPGRTALPLRGTPLLLVLEQLESRALAGEGVAACRLASELIACSRLPDRMRQNLARRDRLIGRQPPGGAAQNKAALEREIAAIARAELAVESDTKRCAGVGPKHWNAAYEYQRVAADAGNLQSMREFLVRPALEFDVFAQMDQYRRFPADARRLLERNVRAGDQHVLLGLLHAFREHHANGRFTMRTFQALHQTPAELEVYLEVARITGIGSARTSDGRVVSDLPKSMCPGADECAAILKRAQSIASDYASRGASMQAINQLEMAATLRELQDDGTADACENPTRVP